MKDETTSRSASFLVRLWAEPREIEGESAPVRGFLRNLRTGEEHYLSDPGGLAELLTRPLVASESAEEDGEGLKRAAWNAGRGVS